jgi:hypothetical protein
MDGLFKDLAARKKLFDDTPPEEVKYWFEYAGPLQVSFKGKNLFLEFAPRLARRTRGWNGMEETTVQTPRLECLEASSNERRHFRFDSWDVTSPFPFSCIVHLKPKVILFA